MLDPDLCIGAVVQERGNLRLTTEYPEYTGEERFYRYYDLRHNSYSDSWYVFYSGLTALNEAAELNSYKDEIVNLHNAKAKDDPWIEEIEKTDVVTRQIAKGQLSEYGEATVILFGIMLYESPWPHYPVFVIKSDEGTTYWHWLDEHDGAAYLSIFYLHDIDGDGYDEIITQHDIGANGGFGGYVSSVYQIRDNALEQLFTSVSDGWVLFDTGFSLTSDDGFQLTVRNRNVPFETTFTREQYETPYFDDDGKVMSVMNEDTMMVDSFYIFIPLDIDGDGVYEIMTAQYCSLWSHVDGVGSAYTILKYDSQMGEMRVIKAGFWKYIEDGDEDYDAFNEQWAHYERNWYRE
jgi:hypothetical protein